jgi:hypothetical protein
MACRPQDIAKKYLASANPVRLPITGKLPRAKQEIDWTSSGAKLWESLFGGLELLEISS